jgi:hypothetical protein
LLDWGSQTGEVHDNRVVGSTSSERGNPLDAVTSSAPGGHQKVVNLYMHKKFTMQRMKRQKPRKRLTWNAAQVTRLARAVTAVLLAVKLTVEIIKLILT